MFNFVLGENSAVTIVYLWDASIVIRRLGGIAVILNYSDSYKNTWVYFMYVPITTNVRRGSEVYAAVATPCKLINNTCAPNCKLQSATFLILRRRAS